MPVIALGQFAGALEAPVNELIDTTFGFGCCPSSKAANVVPKGAPSAGTHGTHAQHTTLRMPFKCCNFRPTGHWPVWHHPSCWVRHGWGCRPYSALPLAVTNDIRHQPACGQLLDLRQLGLQLLSEGNSRCERLIFDRSDQQNANQRTGVIYP
jgi:hypothetical protein